MVHHTVATMLGGILGACYCCFIIAHAISGNPVPNTAALAIVSNAIVALGLKGYYKHLQKAKKVENP